MLFQITYYFFAVSVLFLLFEKTGILALKLANPTGIYAAASLFASASTLILFSVSNFIYGSKLRRAARFVANLLGVLVASVIPLLVLVVASLLWSTHFSLTTPILSSLFRAWSYLVPTVWIGWLVITLLFHDSNDHDANGEAEPPSTNQSKAAARTTSHIALPSTSSPLVEAVGRQSRPQWMIIHEVALLRIGQQEFEAARPLLVEVLSMIEKDPQVDRHFVLTVTHQMAKCLLALREFKLARYYFERSLRLLNRIPVKEGVDDGVIFAELMDGLEECYRNSSQPSNTEGGD